MTPSKKTKPKEGSPSDLESKQREALLVTLKERFDEHRERHRDIEWRTVESRLLANPDALRSLDAMERTGGEPDVVGVDAKTGAVRFVDCSAESPSGRRSLCYDGAALESRKEHKPKSSALEMADAMGIEILTEADYRELQRLGEFDLKTSSWLKTPTKIRSLGGAIFGDRRYDTVWVHHNGAESYFQARGFRGSLIV